MAVTAPISSRRDILGVFDSRIQRTHSDLLEETELEFERNMLKTAIIESDIEPDSIRNKDMFSDIIKVEDEITMAQTIRGGEDGWLFFDFHDSRFWIVYSMGKSKFFNSALRGLVDSEGGGLDRLWLPTEQVEKIGEMGNMKELK
jgi:hypothetical protein